MKAKLVVYEGQDPSQVDSFPELLELIDNAGAEAIKAGDPNIIFVEMPGGNNISLVVGAGELTVLGFTYGHGNPPYFASKGPCDADEPIMTAYVSLSHHTEFPRRYVISMQHALLAIEQFLETDELPTNIDWIEL